MAPKPALGPAGGPYSENGRRIEILAAESPESVALTV
jgi:hypothetical protein